MPDAWSQDEVNGCSQFAAMMQNCAQTRVDQDTFLQRTTEKKFDGAMPLKEKNSLSRLKLFIFLQNCVFSMPSLNEKIMILIHLLKMVLVSGEGNCQLFGVRTWFPFFTSTAIIVSHKIRNSLCLSQRSGTKSALEASAHHNQLTAKRIFSKICSSDSR
jgi:hypothetical protein